MWGKGTRIQTGKMGRWQHRCPPVAQWDELPKALSVWGWELLWVPVLSVEIPWFLFEEYLELC